MAESVNYTKQRDMKSLCDKIAKNTKQMSLLQNPIGFARGFAVSRPTGSKHAFLSGCSCKTEVLQEPQIFTYFLDGSRHVYKVDDQAYFDGVRALIYPIIAGQAGVGCCKRVDKKYILGGIFMKKLIAFFALALSVVFFADSITAVATRFAGNRNPEFITIAGVEYSTSLTMLSLSFLDLTDEDILPLRYMTNLKWLLLNDNQITDITPLVGLVNLDILTLGYNQITDLSPLSDLVNLVRIDLSNSQIADITPLSNLVNLDGLMLDFNQITDISPLSGLVNLELLILGDNQITDWSPVEHGLAPIRYTKLSCYVP